MSSSADRALEAVDVGLQGSPDWSMQVQPGGMCWRCTGRRAEDAVGLCRPCHDDLENPETVAPLPEEEDEVTMVDVLVPGVLMPRFSAPRGRGERDDR